MTFSIESSKNIYNDQNNKKQVKFLNNQYQECREFLSEIANSEITEDITEEITELAKQTQESLNELIQTNQQASLDYKSLALKSNQLIQHLLILHLVIMEQSSKDPAKRLTSNPISFLKRFTKLEKLFDKGKALTHDKINYFTQNVVISLNDDPLIPTMSGTANSSFFVKGKDQKKLMLFKPNKGDVGAFSAIPKGDTFRRQIAAYLIDNAHEGKVEVPMSILADNSEEGLGSLQIFKKNRGEFRNLSAEERKFIPTTLIQIATIHRLRLYDLDGHEGNQLWKKDQFDQYRLIPIDFDYILPLFTDRNVDSTKLKIGWRFESQLEEPLTEETLEYLLKIDPEVDAVILKNLGFYPEQETLIKMATWFLQEGAKEEFTLGEMLDFMHSNFFKISCLENSENSSEQMRAVIQEMIKLMKNEKALKSTITKEGMEAINKKENPIFQIRNLFEDYSDARSSFNLLKELILSNGPDDYIKECITYFKQYSRLEPYVMHDGLVMIFHTLEAKKKRTISLELEDWLKKEFSV